MSATAPVTLELDHGEAATVTALLYATEGLPLAIELAAARVPVLGVRGLLDRLDRRLDILGESSGARHPRHSSLRASIHWSWEVLPEPAQRALAQLAVFRGGFPVEAVEYAFADQGVELLETLHDRCLIRMLRPGRFGHYDSVREYALQQLDARGERLAATAAFARWVIDYCSTALARPDALAILGEERLNLEQALDWALVNEQAELASAAVSALGRLLSAKGPAEQHLRLLTRTLALVPGVPSLLHARGKACHTLGRLTEAEHDFLAALAACRGTLQAAEISKDIGVLHHQRRAFEEAGARYREALARAAGPEGERVRAMCIANLGALDHDAGNYESALSQYHQALAMLRRLGVHDTEGIVLTNLAILEQECGQLTRARRHFDRALSALDQCPHMWSRSPYNPDPLAGTFEMRSRLNDPAGQTRSLRQRSPLIRCKPVVAPARFPGARRNVR